MSFEYLECIICVLFAFKQNKYSFFFLKKNFVICLQNYFYSSFRYAECLILLVTNYMYAFTE